MKINQVEELTGIPKKNIRFYEDQKLVSPQRNLSNGYREYSMDDVALLNRIKLFRKLGIPIESIRKMENGEEQLDDCLYRKVHELRAASQNIEQMQAVCQEILSTQACFDNINTEFYLEEIENLEKGGTQFVNAEQENKRHSIVVPIIFAGLIVVLMIALTALVWYLNSIDPAPFGVVQIFTLIALAVCAGVIYACIERIKEIKGGELDEARLGKDFMAGMKTLVGGEIVGYTEMVVEARAIATKRMVDEAEALGADAIIGIRYGSSSVMQSAAEVLAYGTAIRFI